MVDFSYEIDRLVFLQTPVISSEIAAVAELADAQASGACALRGVKVRLLSAAFDSPSLCAAVARSRSFTRFGKHSSRRAPGTPSPRRRPHPIRAGAEGAERKGHPWQLQSLWPRYSAIFDEESYYWSLSIKVIPSPLSPNKKCLAVSWAISCAKIPQ